MLAERYQNTINIAVEQLNGKNLVLAKKVILGTNEQRECLILSLFLDGVAVDSPTTLEVIGFCEQRGSNNIDRDKDARSLPPDLELHT